MNEFFGYLSCGRTTKAEIRLSTSPVNDRWLDLFVRDGFESYKLVATLTEKDAQKLVDLITKHQQSYADGV